MARSITLDSSLSYREMGKIVGKEVYSAGWGETLILQNYDSPKEHHAFREHIPISEVWDEEQATYIKNFNTSGIEWIREPIESKYLIFIPNVNTPDLTLRAIESLRNHSFSTVVVDSGKDEVHWPDQVGLAKVTTSISFSQLQNWFQKQAQYRNLDRFYFMHSDAEASENTFLRLLAFYKSNPEWDVVQTNYDALIAFKTNSIAKFGVWDETFQWYVSDVDFYNRCRWNGCNLLVCEETEVSHTNPSSTLRNLDSKLVSEISANHEWAVRHYQHKWGYNFQIGLGEPYSSPYNVDSGVQS